MFVKITAQRQITLPARVLEALGVKLGDRIELQEGLGIVITMYFNDHTPPHFHVRYEAYRAVIGIQPLELRDGQLPPRVLGLVMEWGEMHQSELMENWTTLAEEGIFRRIAPLV